MRDIRRKLEGERAVATARLRQMGGPVIIEESPAPANAVFDEADHIQAAEQREMGLMSRERLVEKIGRLTAALERLASGTYGTCVECGNAIGAARLKAIPEVATCVACQEKIERQA